jgi:hypothetical protein
MAALINQVFGNYWHASFGVGDVDKIMEDNRYYFGTTFIIAGVRASGSSGQLRKGWPSGKFSGNGPSHFVVITGTSVQWNENNVGNEDEPSPWKWVRVYNPFDNEIEYYWWGDLKSSWEFDLSAYVKARRINVQSPYQPK